MQSDQWSFSARQFPGPDEPIFDSGASVTMISSNTSTPAKDEAGHDSSESEDGLAIYNPSNASSGRSQNRAAEPRASVGAIATSPSSDLVESGVSCPPGKQEQSVVPRLGEQGGNYSSRSRNDVAPGPPRSAGEGCGGTAYTSAQAGPVTRSQTQRDKDGGEGSSTGTRAGRPPSEMETAQRVEAAHARMNAYLDGAAANGDVFVTERAHVCDTCGMLATAFGTNREWNEDPHPDRPIRMCTLCCHRASLDDSSSPNHAAAVESEEAYRAMREQIDRSAAQIADLEQQLARQREQLLSDHRQQQEALEMTHSEVNSLLARAGTAEGLDAVEEVRLSVLLQRAAALWQSSPVQDNLDGFAEALARSVDASLEEAGRDPVQAQVVAPRITCYCGHDPVTYTCRRS